MLDQMCSNKVLALTDRGEIRDAFDLEFLARRGVALELKDEDRQKIIKKLRGFKKRDFDVKLGSVLLPEVRAYYRQQASVFGKESGWESSGTIYSIHALTALVFPPKL
jgi:hypothetical protein